MKNELQLKRKASNLGTMRDNIYANPVFAVIARPCEDVQMMNKQMCSSSGLNYAEITNRNVVVRFRGP